MGRRPVSCISFAPLLSATISPPKATRTRRGESSKYSVCGLSAPVSKLNSPAFWLPKGPVPIVRVIVSLLSGRCAPASPGALLYRERILVHPGTRCVLRGYPIESKTEPGRQCAIPRRGRSSRRLSTYRGEETDASGDRHGRGQRRADLLRGCGRRRAAG